MGNYTWAKKEKQDITNSMNKRTKAQVYAYCLSTAIGEKMRDALMQI